MPDEYSKKGYKAVSCVMFLKQSYLYKGLVCPFFIVKSKGGGDKVKRWEYVQFENRAQL